jgi:hypothetical protein
MEPSDSFAIPMSKIQEGTIEKGEAQQTTRSRCKGREGLPLLHSFIHSFINSFINGMLQHLQTKFRYVTNVHVHPINKNEVLPMEELSVFSSTLRLGVKMRSLIFRS